MKVTPTMTISTIRLEDAEATHLAATAADSLQKAADGPLPARVRLSVETAEGEMLEISVPRESVKLMSLALSELARGNAVTMTPVHAELTTQQAADRLNVSRPYLIGLLDSGEIPHRRVGNRRKVRLDDLLSFAEKDEIERMRVLDELAAESENLGLYD